jgi:hypothetical protein
MLAIAGVGIL